jgi:glycosyltransferase involved in cell wall biosynthesis
MADTVVLIPVLQRPHRAEPVARSIRETSDARPLFICSPQDKPEHAAVAATGADSLRLPVHNGPGDYARKINYGYENSNEPFLFLAADDLQFHPGWLEAAKRHLSGTVQVVGTNDLGNARVIAGNHSTHTFVTRDYCDRYGTIDQPGRVLCEEYPHEFVDDEFISTAKARGVYAHAHDSHVEHLHPNWNKAPTDALYRQEPVRIRMGRDIFIRRQRLWT